jgi:hypothetical protein
MPPVSGGSPGSGSLCSSSITARSATSGSPLVGSPTGTSPVQVSSPSTTVSAAAERTPTNEKRDQDRPFSADSSRNVPGRSPASLR